MLLGDYFRLLRENRFKIDVVKYPMTVLGAGCASVNSVLRGVQQFTHGKRIANANLDRPPVFVIGHWRSGTTLMHELMAKDQRFDFPNNFDAFVPNHFLVSRFCFYPIVKLLMPRKRPMDNMAMGVELPQEDDFALCGLGAPTPYRRIAFPNRPNRDHLNLNLSQANPQVQEQVRHTLEQFLKTLTVQYDSRLVLKSPPHTGRLRQLVEWFPGAKFIHMSRHPYRLVPSTMRLWKLLDSLQGFQLPRYDDTWLKNYIFECKDLMYSAYQEQRDEVPSNLLVEVKFENLVANPVAEMERVYNQLQLGEFEKAKPSIDEYFDRRKGHKTNPAVIDDGLRLDIDVNWREYMDLFGYEAEEPKTQGF